MFVIIKAILPLLLLTLSLGHPTYDKETSEHLQTIPDQETYSKITFPDFQLIDLGTYQKGSIPPKIVHITKHIIVKQPKPYPVKIPHPVPYPVKEPVPVPIIKTQLVKVPHPVPYPVHDQVHVPVEVPKPYPVPVQEYSSHQSEDHGGNSNQQNYAPSSNGGSSESQHVSEHQGHQSESSYDESGQHEQIPQQYGVPGHTPGEPIGESNQNSFSSNHYDQSYQNYHQQERSDNFILFLEGPPKQESKVIPYEHPVTEKSSSE